MPLKSLRRGWSWKWVGLILIFLFLILVKKCDHNLGLEKLISKKCLQKNKKSIKSFGWSWKSLTKILKSVIVKSYFGLKKLNRDLQKSPPQPKSLKPSISPQHPLFRLATKILTFLSFYQEITKTPTFY